MSELPQITVEELATRLASGDPDQQLVDVREPAELALAQIPGFMNLPLSKSGVWSQNIQAHLDPTKSTLVLCHHGMRSAQMCGWLIEQGFASVENISGGIDAYAIRVDPGVGRY
jgi:rhodanese-related sulfurtransferase